MGKKLNTCYIQTCEKTRLKEGEKDWPFCSEQHHEEWADETYGKQGSNKGKYKTKEEIQDRIKEIIQEKRKRKMRMIGMKV